MYISWPRHLLWNKCIPKSKPNDPSQGPPAILAVFPIKILIWYKKLQWLLIKSLYNSQTTQHKKTFLTISFEKAICSNPLPNMWPYLSQKSKLNHKSFSNQILVKYLSHQIMVYTQSTLQTTMNRCQSLNRHQLGILSSSCLFLVWWELGSSMT